MFGLASTLETTEVLGADGTDNRDTSGPCCGDRSDQVVRGQDAHRDVRASIEDAEVARIGRPARNAVHWTAWTRGVDHDLGLRELLAHQVEHIGRPAGRTSETVVLARRQARRGLREDRQELRSRLLGQCREDPLKLLDRAPEATAAVAFLRIRGGAQAGEELRHRLVGGENLRHSLAPDDRCSFWMPSRHLLFLRSRSLLRSSDRSRFTSSAGIAATARTRASRNAPPFALSP